MYAMDSAVHSEHNSETRRVRRDAWSRRTSPHDTPTTTPGPTPSGAAPAADDYAD